MAEGTYEHECMRAELLGLSKPNQAEYEQMRAERAEQEQAEQEAAEAALLESQEEALRNTGGKLDELNSILSTTQQKLNRFKQTACGSLTNIFNRGSVDIPESSGGSNAASGGGGAAGVDLHNSRRNTTAGSVCSGDGSDINTALDDLQKMQQQEEGNGDIQPRISTEKIRAAKVDIQKKMSSHLSKLDSLINKADTAEIAMSEQTKQMRKMAD